MARPLDNEEKALWGRVIASVKPLHPVPVPMAARPVATPAPAPKISKKGAKPENGVIPKKARPSPPINAAPVAPPSAKTDNLDGGWDRRISKGSIMPDISVDLHGKGLSSAYSRLDGALEQAIATGMRVVLLVTGKPRAHDRTSGEGRGAIAAVIRDWLAASRHSRSISAVRNAHPRHGGAGALYIILKR